MTTTSPPHPGPARYAGPTPPTGAGAGRLSRLRWAVRAVLALGVAASIAANVLHARPNLISQLIAAWPPLALLLTVELISRVPADRRGLAVVRLLAATVIAGLAAWVSYWHMAGVAVIWGWRALLRVDLGFHVVDMSMTGRAVGCAGRLGSRPAFA